MLYRQSLRKVLGKLPSSFRSSLIRNFPTIFFPPFMSKNEFKFFKKNVDNAGSIVEFGAGGSTSYFLSKEKSLCSVESDKSFYDFLMTFPLIRKKIEDKSLQFLYVDIGDTGELGKPKDDSQKDNWSDYYLNVWEIESSRNPDIVFVDGRFRVMCALSAIPFLKKETKVIIHDFARRENYGAVLDFYDVIDQVENIVILKLKENINSEKLVEIKKSHELDYR